MSHPDIPESAVRHAAGRATDPEFGRPLADLDMLKGVVVEDDGRVRVDVELPTPVYPEPERITAAVRAAISSAVPKAGEVQVEFTSKVRGKPAGGGVNLQAKNVIAVGSGKGGVGKSTVAASLAYGLKHLGASVGLMDADVYGPSIPHLVGVSGRPAAVERHTPQGEIVQRIEPLDADGLKVMSMGFFVEPEKAVVWRGPLLHRAIQQFLGDTEWGEIDYLIIDMPPGTGDVSLTLSQAVGLAGAVIVCTPQQVALLDAVKAVSMFRQVNVPILGMVENMSGDIFGRGGAREKAQELGVPFLGELPTDARIRIEGDAGRMGALFDDDCPTRPQLLEICRNTAMEVARSLMSADAPQMPTLEIL